MHSRAARATAAFLVSGALLALLLSQLDLGQALARFASADPGWLALAGALSLAVLVTRGVRYAALCRRAPLPLATAATAIQVFLNRVTPLRLGELSLPYLLARHAGEDAGHSLVQVVLVRLVDLAIVVAAIVLAISLRGDGRGWLEPAAALVGLVALLGTFRHWLRFSIRAARAACRALRLDRLAAVERGLGKLAAAAADGTSLAPGRRLVLAGTSLAVFVVQTAMFGALLEAFGIRLPLLALAQGGAVAQAGAAIPIAAVGTFGTQEASWVAGYTWVGVPLEDAIVTGVAVQLVTLAFAAAFALPAWLWLQRRPAAAPAA